LLPTGRGWADMNVDLLSSLPRTECAQRLRQHVSGEWSLLTDSGVVGTITGDTSFVMRKKIYYRNSFQRRLHGQLSDAPSGGTRIHGETREMDLKWVFVLAGIVVAIAFIGVGVTLFTLRDQLHDIPIAAIIGPVLLIPVLVGIMVAMVAVGRRLAHSEEAFLVDWLKRTLDAR